MPSAAVKPTAPPSSSGLGHRPFKAAARVRIPLGARAAGRWTYLLLPVRAMCGPGSGPGLAHDVPEGLAQRGPISGPRGSKWPVGSFLPNGSPDSPWLRGSPTPPRFRQRRGEAFVHVGASPSPRSDGIADRTARAPDSPADPDLPIGERLVAILAAHAAEQDPGLVRPHLLWLDRGDRERAGWCFSRRGPALRS
jgi:hypothetical protein